VLVVEAGEKEGGRRPRFSKSADAKQVALLLQKAASWKSKLSFLGKRFWRSNSSPKQGLNFLGFYAAKTLLMLESGFT